MRPLSTRIAFERVATAQRLRARASAVGLKIEKEVDATGDFDIADVTGCDLLFIEQRDSSDAVAARLFSLTSAAPDVLVVVVIPAPRGETDSILLNSGAFDVLDDSDDLEADLAHTAAAARRVVALQEDRARLNSELTHQEKLSALGVLAAGVSHEINNPCAAILSNVNVVREQLESVLAGPRFHRMEALDRFATDWIEAMGDCIGAAKRIESIVKTLNVFSRKNDSLPEVPTDLNEEIRTVIRLIGKEVRFHARFEINLSPLLPRIKAPPNSITQILTNLVVNALQALEGNAGVEQPTISIATDFDDEHVMMEVADNGPGIPPDVLGRIFDPFFTTKAVGKGTGLGLSITQQLVQKVGGEIFAESNPGLGARFRVVIERREDPIEVKGTGQKWLPPASDRLRVLLLDDDDLILRSMQRSLSPHFECQTVAQARTALDMLTSDGDFDAVVSDVVMPDMNGFEFWTELEQTRPELALKTVFISGGITSEQLRVHVSDTGRPCLSKPVDIHELIRTIRRLGRHFEELHR